MFKQKEYKKIAKIFIISCFVILFSSAVFLFFGQLAQAQGVDPFGGYQGDIESNLGLGRRDPRVIIANIIRVILGFLGIIGVGLILYAGFLWMSSEGNEEKINQAKKTLKNAAIGLTIILSSFAIVTFILNRLIVSTGGISSGPGPSGPGPGGLAALGSGIIESHYPARNASNISRNTSIVVTFKEAMDASTLITGGNINTANVLIYKTVDGVSGPFVTNVTANTTLDDKTFVFKPVDYLGSPSERIWYSVAFTTGTRKASGDDAFPGVIGTIGYDWSFEVSTIVDVTPPEVVSIVPFPSSTEPRNIIVQINFSEAIDPLSASGASSAGFNNIVINNVTDTAVVGGIFYLSNQYRTVEFLTEDACGVNSCGNTVYCLPGLKDISPLVKAATLVAVGEPTSAFPYDGIVDMAANSLDGNKDGTAEGPEPQSGQPPYNQNSPDPPTQGDDYVWLFSTNNTIDISAPFIEIINPSIGATGVDFNQVPEAVFSKLLSSNSVNSGSVYLVSAPIINYWINVVNNHVDKKTTVYINHDQFSENTDYSPRFNSAIKDIYQNCYSPCSGLGVVGAPSCCNGSPSLGTTCP